MYYYYYANYASTDATNETQARAKRTQHSAIAVCKLLVIRLSN